MTALLREVKAIRQILAERLPGPPAVMPELKSFLFDPLELKIVQTVAEAGPLPLKAVARRTGNLSRSGRTKTRLRQSLASLVRRRVLIGDRGAYRVNPDLARLVPDLVRPPPDTS